MPDALGWLDDDDSQNDRPPGRLKRWRDTLDSLQSKLVGWREGPHLLDRTCQARCFPSGERDQAGVPFCDPFDPQTTSLGDIAACLDTEYQNEADPILKEKLRARSEYMNNLAREMDDAISWLDTAISRFDAFIGSGGPAEALIDDWLGFYAVPESRSLRRMAIYGWKSPEDQGDKWHIVRVDVKFPGMCVVEKPGESADCSRLSTPEQEFTMFPYIKVWQGGLSDYYGRWYSLGDSFGLWHGCSCDGDGCNYDNARNCFRGGTAMAQVIRYDEDGDYVRLANNLRIWRFLTSRPGSGDLLSQMISDCGLGDQRAFLLNQPISDPGNPALTSQCWDTVNKLLMRGVKSESCVEYFWDGPDQGFEIQFVPCRGKF